MVKDLRYIIKKIIIGVGIALALMFIKTNVFAMETKQVIPTSLHVVDPSDRTFSINTFSYPGFPTLYGYNFNSASSQRGYIYFTFNGSNLDINNQLDINATLFTSVGDGNYNNMRALIVDGNGSTFSCNVSSGQHVATTSQSYPFNGLITTIKCNNVALSTKNFRLIIGDQFINSTNYPISITALTIYNSSSNSEMVEAINNGTNATKEQTQTIKDDSVDNDKASDDIDNMKSKVSSNGTITQLLTLPITLYQAILNSVNGSCSPISLGSLYGHNLSISCINLSTLLGSTLYNIIDVLCCGFFILSFRKKMVDIFNNMTSLKDRGNELE